MKDLWNEICYDLSDCKRRNVLEKEYENTIVQCLAILGWKKYLGEITTQYPIQVGHETKLADIVVSSNGTEQFVIEVKKPGHIICPEDERQMFSYMRLLKHQVLFGLYIGDDIRLYYDDKSSQEFPEPLFVVDITKDNPNGVQLVELFVKEAFDVEKLQEFCRLKKEEINLEQKVKEETARLLADKDGNILKQLYKEHCINIGLYKDFAERVLENISVMVLSEGTSPHVMSALYGHGDSLERVRSDKGKGEQSKKRRSYKFNFNGVECKNSNTLAFAIAKQFINDNPKLIYDDLCKNFPKCARLITLADYERLEKTSNDQNISKRWFLQPDELFCSSDNVYFAIPKGWTYHGYGNNNKDNICTMIDFARKQGYAVEEL